MMPPRVDRTTGDRRRESAAIPAKVYLDHLTDRKGMPLLFGARIASDRWNGWARPFFDRAEAERIRQAFNRLAPRPSARYDSNRDAFIFDDPDGGVEGFDGVTVDGLWLYPIGSESWCWSAEGDFDD